MKNIILAVIAFSTLMVASPTIAAETLTYDTNPSVAFNYGSGNNYTPANAAVLTTTDPTSQLATRFHVPFAVAASSGGDGVYDFALGTPSISVDYSISNMLTGQIQLINLLTGQTYDSGVFTLNNLLLQDSQQLTFNFINSSLGYDGNVNNTYQVNLISTNNEGSHMLTAFARIGSGAPVPEPATWGMMLLGFGGIGGVMRRQRRAPKLAQIA
jgi:hypothetical protein